MERSGGSSPGLREEGRGIQGCSVLGTLMVLGENGQEFRHRSQATQ